VSPRDERPLGEVPRWLWLALAAALAAQIAWQGLRPPAGTSASDLPAPPSMRGLRLASFGEEPATARLLMLYVQAFDLGGANELPYRKLDYTRLAGWLAAALELDPRSEYPLFLAARVYTEVPDPARVRVMLDFIEQEFLRDPDRRWPWLAHAALLAKHKLNDLPLARRYASDIDRFARGANVPAWARQMEIFVLEDMNEFEAAKVLLGGLLASGRITDPAEARFLKQRLEALEARTSANKVK
jgi:hypothetical protein